MRSRGSPRVRTAMAVAVALAFMSAASMPPPALAQSGGGGGGGGGSSGGAGGGSAGAGSTTGGSGSAPSGPSATPPSSGPQIRSPATPPSPIPQKNTGVPPVPSAGNAEPSSPIYRRDTPPGSLKPSQDATGTGLTDGDRLSPSADTPLGSGGGASGSPDTIENSLTPTNPSGGPADSGSGRATSSISDEPNRVTRGGGAAGRDMDECMKLWDKSTHMTRAQWRTTCERLGR